MRVELAIRVNADRVAAARANDVCERAETLFRLAKFGVGDRLNNEFD